MYSDFVLPNGSVGVGETIREIKITINISYITTTIVHLPWDTFGVVVTIELLEEDEKLAGIFLLLVKLRCRVLNSVST